MPEEGPERDGSEPCFHPPLGTDQPWTVPGAHVEGLDDTRHPLLRRAHAVQQSDLGAFGPRDGRRRRRLAASATPYQIQEVEARTALTPCALPGDVWSLNPYTGCSHACLYCYVPDVARMERRRWGSYVIAKRNLPTLLAAEMRRKVPKPIFLSSATDPYQAAEATHAVTRRCLEVMLRHQWPLRVLTRNPLVLRDLDLLTRFEDVQVGMSVPTFDDAARRLLEPGAPSIPRRLACLRSLADAGFAPFVNIAPAYPFTGPGPKAIAAMLAEAGVKDVHVWPWRYLDGVLPALRERVQGTALASFPEHVTHEGYFQRMARSIQTACGAHGMRVHGAVAR